MKLGKTVKKGKLKDHQVILIDKNDYHTYTPTLYEISTTSKEVANYLDLKSVNTFPVKKLLDKLPVEFIEAEVVKIDIQKGDIHLHDGRHIPYRHLIIALGSETNFFNIPGLKEHALELKTFTDALKIRDKILTTVEGAAKDEEVNIVIGGAGATGVELAGEIQQWLTQLKSEGYNCKTSVSIINSSDTILSSFDKRIVKYATRRLKKLGTNIITSERIEGITENSVMVSNGRTIQFHIFIWTGGVKANSLTNIFPFKVANREQITVNTNLLCLPSKSDLSIKSKIYAVGDITCVTNPKTGMLVGSVARVAISQATVAAKNIVRDIQGIKKRAEYKPINYPYVVPVGGKYAIVKFGPIIISGFFGWILKGLVELNYLASIMPIGKTLNVWVKGLRIFIQNDRLG